MILILKNKEIEHWSNDPFMVGSTRMVSLCEFIGIEMEDKTYVTVKNKFGDLNKFENLEEVLLYLKKFN